MQFGKWLASCPRVKNACVCLKDQLTTMVFSSRVGAAQVQGSGGVAAWTAPLARVRWAAPVTDDGHCQLHRSQGWCGARGHTGAAVRRALTADALLFVFQWHVQVVYVLPCLLMCFSLCFSRTFKV